MSIPLTSEQAIELLRNSPEHYATRQQLNVPVISPGKQLTNGRHVHYSAKTADVPARTQSDGSYFDLRLPYQRQHAAKPPRDSNRLIGRNSINTRGHRLPRNCRHTTRSTAVQVIYRSYP